MVCVAYIFSKLLRKMTARPFKYKTTYVAYSYYCFTFSSFCILCTARAHSLAPFLHCILIILAYVLLFFSLLFSYIYSIFQKIVITVYIMYKRCRHLKYERGVFLSFFFSLSLTLRSGFLHLVLLCFET